MAAPGYPTSSEGVPRGGTNITGAPTVRSSRPQAVTRSLGGPRAGRPAPKPQRPGKTSPQGRPAPAAKAAAPAKAKTPFYGGEIPNIGGLASRLQLQQVGAPLHAAEEGEKAATRAPFAAKQGEINYTQNQLEGKTNTMNLGTQAYLQGLVQGSEGSAKTADNYAAEASQKAVETAGQTAQTSVGGFNQAQLANAQAFQRGTAERGQANTAALQQIAAAGGIRGQEELGNVRSRFAGESTRNRAAENQALEKVANRGRNARLEAGQKLYTDLLAKGKLEQAGQLGAAKLAQNQQAINIKGQQANTQERGQRAKSYIEEAKLQIARGEFNRRWAETKNKASQAAVRAAYDEASLKQKGEIDKANVEFKTKDLEAKVQANILKATGKKGQTPSGVAKAIVEFGRALNAMERGGIEASAKKLTKPNYANIRQELGEGFEPVKVGGKTVKNKVPAITNPWLVKAAEEVWQKHYIGTQTKGILNQLGLGGGLISSEALRRG